MPPTDERSSPAVKAEGRSTSPDPSADGATAELDGGPSASGDDIERKGAERELAAVAQRYARRATTDRYSFLRPEVWHMVQERQRAQLRLFAALGWRSLADKTVVEVGCGSGGNLLELLRLGFEPAHLTGLELLPDRFQQARLVLPPAVTLIEGDASRAPLPAACADIVLVSTVFSSLLDDAFQQQLAQTLWRWVKPAGGVLWYDFTVNNPRNPDVRGVPLKRVRQLFPEGRVRAQRITLAPPLARLACAWSPRWYPVLNALPLLRTHVLAWVQRPVTGPIVGENPPFQEPSP